MSNLNRKSSEISWLRENFITVLVSVMFVIAGFLVVKTSVSSLKTTEKGVEVNSLYLDALYHEGQWVRSVNPGGVGGVHPPTAKREADEAFLKLKQAVEQLPSGEKIPLRVKQFIADGPIRPYVGASRK